MKTKKNKNILIVGLPAAGKTTYLAALWHVLNSNEIKNSLRLLKLDGEDEYINKLRDFWLRCEKMPRTLTSSENLIHMILDDPEGNNQGELYLPDLNGEIFMTQWEERKCSKFYHKLISDTMGIILFIYPKEIYKTWQIAEANEMLPNEEDHSPKTTENKNVHWDPTKVSKQAILVDLLQIISHISRNTNLKLSVIISAWDIVQNVDNLIGKKTTPRQWLKENVPLFDQFIHSNPEFYSFNIYGISAQGGDLDEDNNKLLGYAKHSKRIIVQDENEIHNDITQPIKWTIE